MKKTVILLAGALMVAACKVDGGDWSSTNYEYSIRAYFNVFTQIIPGECILPIRTGIESGNIPSHVTTDKSQIPAFDIQSLEPDHWRVEFQDKTSYSYSQGDGYPTRFSLDIRLTDPENDRWSYDMVLDREENHGYSLHYETTGAAGWFTEEQHTAISYRTVFNSSGNFHIDFYRDGKPIDFADLTVDADGKPSKITTSRE